jgi:Holliday junction resolvasome RuvABC endonuclease subunit
VLFLGVDQSLNATGLCLLSKDRDPYLKTVDPGPARGVERLRYVKNVVETFLEAGVQFVAFEGYSYDSVGRVFELGEMGGVLKLLACENNVPMIIVPPATLKKFATSNAGADKSAMVTQAALEMGIPPADDNQADAFFLALIARHVHLRDQPSTRVRAEVLQKLICPSAKPPKRRLRRLVKNSL